MTFRQMCIFVPMCTACILTVMWAGAQHWSADDQVKGALSALGAIASAAAASRLGRGA